jgi:nucleotide-binding universal stress UspA family protein
MPTTDGRVLLAVGDEGARVNTLAFTAAEARRRGCGVHVVHAVPTVVGAPAASLRVREHDAALAEAGRTILLDTEILLRARLGPAASIETELAHGPVVESLVRRSAGACLVVIQPRDPHVLEWLVTSSVANGVAAGALAPVACVTVATPDAGTPEPVVVVGVERPTDSVAELRAGRALAAATGRSLLVVHATVDRHGAPHPVSLETLREQVAAVLGEPVAGGAEATVRVDVDVEPARPADVLVRASTGCALLVVSRRHPSAPPGSALGPVTRTVLHEARCPVLVVEPLPVAPEQAVQAR